MTTFDDDIKIIKNAVYGKEMRTAIVDALKNSRDEMNTMIAIVDQLNSRIDNLPSGGGGGGTVDPSPEPPDNPDIPSGPTVQTKSYSVGKFIIAFDGAISQFSYAGIADKF